MVQPVPIHFIRGARLFFFLNKTDKPAMDKIV